MAAWISASHHSIVLCHHAHNWQVAISAYACTKQKTWKKQHGHEGGHEGTGRSMFYGPVASIDYYSIVWLTCHVTVTTHPSLLALTWEGAGGTSALTELTSNTTDGSPRPKEFRPHTVRHRVVPGVSSNSVSSVSLLVVAIMATILCGWSHDLSVMS